MAAARDHHRRHARVAIGGGEVEARFGVLVPPAVGDRVLDRAVGQRVPIGAYAEMVAGAADVLHAAQRTAPIGGLEQIRRAAVGDEKRVVVRPVLVGIAGAALPVRFDQAADHLRRR